MGALWPPFSDMGAVERGGDFVIDRAKTLRRFGVATRAVGVGVIQVSPAFVMTDDEVEDLADRIGEALDA